MKLAPGPLTPRTVLFHQPLARAVDLQPGRVDHDVNRPARLGSCQRRRERQARTAPGKRGVVGYTNTDIEQGRERAQQALSLPPRPTKGHAQQVPGLDRHVRVVAGSPPLARAGRVPGRERLGRDPDREAAPLLQRPVVRRPVADLVARPGEFVAARLIGFVGHWSPARRGDGPIRPTVVLPKPKAAILHQRRDDIVQAGFGEADVIVDDVARYLLPLRRLVPQAAWISILMHPVGDELFMDWPLLAQMDALIWAYPPL